MLVWWRLLRRVVAMEHVACHREHVNLFRQHNALSTEDIFIADKRVCRLTVLRVRVVTVVIAQLLPGFNVLVHSKETEPHALPIHAVLQEEWEHVAAIFGLPAYLLVPHYAMDIILEGHARGLGHLFVIVF